MRRHLLRLGGAPLLGALLFAAAAQPGLAQDPAPTGPGAAPSPAAAESAPAQAPGSQPGPPPPPGAAPATGAAAQPPAGNPVASAIHRGWHGAKTNIRQSAEQMPEADYAFKPVDTVRTFGQLLAHIAGAGYEFCAAAKGEKSPFSEDHFEKTATTKAQIVKAVSESIAYCDAAYTALTDKSAGEMIKMPFGMGSQPRATALITNAGHLQEHYGNLVTYFRIKGMVPPSSARGQ
jgi:uncharacterized damage-inducible protein DinB